MTEFGGYSFDGVSAVIGVQHTEVSWAMGNFFEISLYIMVISWIYLLYIFGIYWVYHGHIFGILGYIMKIGFQYISYHLVNLMSIISIFTIMSLPNTTISSAYS